MSNSYRKFFKRGDNITPKFLNDLQDEIDSKAKSEDIATNLENGSGAKSVQQKDNTASGEYSHAEGSGTTASGLTSHAEGSGTTASGVYSHAEGSDTTASGVKSHAEGSDTTASGVYSHAEGYSTAASGYASHAEGKNTNTSGFGFIIKALGSEQGNEPNIYKYELQKDTSYELQEVNSFLNYLEIQSSLGNEVYVNTRFKKAAYKVPITKSMDGRNDIILDFSNFPGDRYQLKADSINYFTVFEHSEMGYYNISEGSHAEGINCISSEYAAHSEGYGNKAMGQYSHAEGRENIAMYAAHAEGRNTIAIGDYSHAEGNGTISDSNCAHAEGWNNESSGYASHVEGRNSKSIGDYSHAENYNTQSKGISSHAEGNGTEAIGNSSHVEGSISKASGDVSHAEGRGTIASGESSHAEGSENTASGNSSHAEGSENTASGNSSHAEGYKTKASGNDSHAEGSYTIASGGASHAEGSATTAFGYESHAEGYHTIASKPYQHVQGKYNIEDTTTNSYAHIVGNGDSNNNRSNAHTLDWDGNAWFAGEVRVGENNSKLYSDRSENVVDLAFGFIVEAYAFASFNLYKYKIRKNSPHEVEQVNNFIHYLETHPTVYANTRFKKAAYKVPIGKSSDDEYDIILDFSNFPEDRFELKVDGINYFAVFEHPEMGYYDISEGAHAEGINSISLEYATHSEGYGNKAIGQYAHAEGRENIATYAAHAEGRNTLASGDYSHTEGNGTTASSNCAHAEGWDNESSGYASHSEGRNNKAIGDYSHVEGHSAQSVGASAHAEGNDTKAIGAASHAEGNGTTASGEVSHAEGEATNATQRATHVEGYHTIAAKPYQHVQGKYNIKDTTTNGYAHIVGNGSGDNSRSNAHTLDWDGNAWFAGTVESVNGIIIKSSTPGSTKRFKLIVDDNGTLSTSEI